MCLPDGKNSYCELHTVGVKRVALVLQGTPTGRIATEAYYFFDRVMQELALPKDQGGLGFVDAHLREVRLSADGAIALSVEVKDPMGLADALALGNAVEPVRVTPHLVKVTHEVTIDTEVAQKEGTSTTFRWVWKIHEVNDQGARVGG